MKVTLTGGGSVNIRRAFSAAVLTTTMAAVPLLVAAPAESIPVCKAGYQCTRTYYTDRTYETPVGGMTKFCDGTVDQWGTTTSYVETTQAQCPLA